MNEKAAVLRDLHRPGDPLILPNVWDAGSAAVVATLLEPVTAAVLAALVLDERVGPLGVVGSLLILGAVAGVHRRPSLDAVPPG